ncbi:MAG: phosphopantothenoylcysteine decarboxylase, partial [Oscillospiraceae bacterium]
MFVNVENVVSAEDLFKAVTENAQSFDIIIKAAAVADYTPAETADSKLKKSDNDMKIELKRTKDILKYLGEHKRSGQLICGFSMETDNVLENSAKKLKTKNCDMICANSLRTEGAGFGTDTNIITLITADGAEELPVMTKLEAAHKILDRLAKL